MIHAQSQITKLFITLVNSHVIVIYVYYSINYIRFILSSVSFIGKVLDLVIEKFDIVKTAEEYLKTGNFSGFILWGDLIVKVVYQKCVFL